MDFLAKFITKYTICAIKVRYLINLFPCRRGTKNATTDTDRTLRQKRIQKWSKKL